MNRTLRCGLALLGALLWVGPVARADEGPPPPVAPEIRPVGAVRISLLSGVPDLFSASLSLSFLRPLELEVGGSTLLLLSSTYARAGVALPLLNTRDASSRGWTLHVLGMAGYRFVQTVPLDTVAWYHGVTANAGLEAVDWFGPHIGVDLQLVVGGVYWFDTNRPNDTRLIPDLRFAFGVAF